MCTGRRFPKMKRKGRGGKEGGSQVRTGEESRTGKVENLGRITKFQPSKNDILTTKKNTQEGGKEKKGRRAVLRPKENRPISQTKGNTKKNQEGREDPIRRKKSFAENTQILKKG